MIRFFKDTDLAQIKTIALANAKEILLNVEDVVIVNKDRTMVYEIDDEIVAFGFYQPFSKGERIDISIVVDTKFRRQGIATQLWDNLTRRAKMLNHVENFECRMLYGDVPALEFCQNLGFSHWITTQIMIYNDELLPTPHTIFTPYEDKYYDSYYELLGQSFYSLRQRLGSQPFKIMPNGNHDEMFAHETFLAINQNDIPIAAVTIENGNFIENLCVLPDAQGLGFGRQIAMFATNRCLMSEEGFAQLEVVASNVEACELYRSLGYKIHRSISVLKLKL